MPEMPACGLSSAAIFIALVAVIVIPVQVSEGLVLISDQTSGQLLYNLTAPRIWRFGGESRTFNQTNGFLVLQNSTLPKNGSVVFVFPTAGRTWESLIVPLYHEGAIAVVAYNRFATKFSGRLQIVRDGTDVTGVNLGVYEIPFAAGEDILKLLAVDESRNVTNRLAVSISCCDSNPWLEAYVWYAPFWAVLNAVWVVINLAIILQRLWIYRQVVGGFFPITIGPFVLFIDILHIMSILLISLYWAEIMTEKTAKVSSFLKRFRIPFIIACVLVLAIEFIGSGFRAAFYELTFLTFLTQIVYLLLLLAGVIIYLGSVGKRLVRTTRLLILSSFGVLIILICLVLPLIPQVYNTIYGFPAVFGVGQVGGNLACTFRALAFGASLKRKKEGQSQTGMTHSAVRSRKTESNQSHSTGVDLSVSATTS